MKTYTTRFKYFVTLSVFIIQGMVTGTLYAQKTDCVQCGDNNNSGEYSTTIGQNITASDFASFASGYEVYSTNAFSFAHGKFINNSGTNSIALGSCLNSTNQHNIVFGHGYDNNNRLENSIGYSLMIGFNSSKPTFFVGESTNGANSTGKIGIGNVTSPQAKLHIRADENYDTASVYIQGYSENRPAYLWLGTKNFGLQKQSTSLEFLTDGDYVFSGGNLGIGTSSPGEKLEVVGNIKQANRYRIETEKIQSLSREGLKIFTSGGTGIFIDERGQVGIAKTNPGAALDVNGKLKTVSLQIPTANPLGEPKDIAGYVLQSRDNYGNVGWVPQASLDDGDWSTTASEGLYFDLGRVGIGTDDPCSTLEVKGEITASAFYGDGSQITGIEGLNLGNHIMTQNLLTAGHWINSDIDENQGIFIGGGGQVGIGTNQVYDGYTFSVAGAIRVEEVQIEHIADWYDCVFEDDYELPSLSDIEAFVKENKHLPDVPSEEDVMDQGINLGEMNAILLKKVEELTLHLIEQQKQIDELKKGM